MNSSKRERASAEAAAEAPAEPEAVSVGGRVEVGRLKRPDFKTVRASARQQVLERFARLTVGPEEKLRLAAEAVDEAEAEIERLQPERDAALASVAFYTTARGVDMSAGLARTGTLRVQRRALGLGQDAKLPTRAEQPDAARAAGVRFVPNADVELPKVAVAYEAAEARRATSIEIRDAAVLTLLAAPHSWSQVRIAEAIKRDFTLVSYIAATKRKS
ncbi:hypothetical protein [Streptomyces noursei]|uniref:hypothetical protein n=1 Tax=Streptomyces noursei TaxID=1971 RepID=UPI0023B862C1|nr:hypothetical protein [Streptomyces noursei]